MGFLGAGNYQQARGVAVEAVDDARPLGMRAARRQPAERLSQRGATVAGRGVRDHARRLVDHEQMLVAVDDLEVDCRGI